MKTSTGKATKAQQARFEKLIELGCICCRKNFGMWRMPEIHHIIDGGRRLGHDQTLPLCRYHHQGQYPDETSTFSMLLDAGWGPPGPPGRRDWVAEFGTELDLLRQLDQILGKEDNE